MFGNLSNPVSAYKSVSVDSAITSADPHRLILLLFEAAVVAIGQAKLHMAAGRIAEKGQMISKAIDIVGNGLKASLDLERGGDLAEKLAALYDYIAERLLFANLRNNLGALDEVLALLGEIHSAWIEIGRQAGAEPAAA